MKNLINFVPQFRKKSILVIGDIMVDRFIWGNVLRISPEAPVPVVEVTKETQALGGAGNVANNLSSLGAKVNVIAVIGDDLVGEQIRDSLKTKNIATDGIVVNDSRPTIIKTRIIAQHQQVVRVDKEIKGTFSQDIEKQLEEKISLIVP
ncbi:MAG: PfkB family carbohydrate kinase, partial [Elusimicrobia bacterium]|nr:PfkB family carbohydrate kinase [Elusimicrobiota bacterium]